jgi:hypothetical protein
MTMMRIFAQLIVGGDPCARCLRQSDMKSWLPLAALAIGLVVLVVLLLSFGSQASGGLAAPVKPEEGWAGRRAP